MLLNDVYQNDDSIFPIIFEEIAVLTEAREKELETHDKLLVLSNATKEMSMKTLFCNGSSVDSMPEALRPVCGRVQNESIVAELERHGQTHLVEHTVLSESQLASRQKYSFLPIMEQSFVKELVSIGKGVIEPLKLKIASPVVQIKRKEGRPKVKMKRAATLDQ